MVLVSIPPQGMNNFHFLSLVTKLDSRHSTRSVWKTECLLYCKTTHLLSHIDILFCCAHFAIGRAICSARGWARGPRRRARASRSWLDGAPAATAWAQPHTAPRSPSHISGPPSNLCFNNYHLYLVMRPSHRVIDATVMSSISTRGNKLFSNTYLENV